MRASWLEAAMFLTISKFLCLSQAALQTTICICIVHRYNCLWARYINALCSCLLESRVLSLHIRDCAPLLSSATSASDSASPPSQSLLLKLSRYLSAAVFGVSASWDSSRFHALHFPSLFLSCFLACFPSSYWLTSKALRIQFHVLASEAIANRRRL